MPRKKKESKQELPELNIGLIGHVDHGKTTLTQKLSGKWTDTHSEELKKGITIRLGYADTSFWKIGSGKAAKFVAGNKKPDAKKVEFLKKVSFVDAPGHESLMATMLSGATLMDGALLLIAANEKCPQPQTREHLMALEIIGVKQIVIAQNKIDLVSREEAIKNYKQIKRFLKGTPYEGASIIPISAQHNANIDKLIEAIHKFIKTPKRDVSKTPLMFVARSFDINKPGTKINNLIGGVLGGSVVQGTFKIDEEIEIKPGYSFEKKNQKVWKALRTKVVGLMSGSTSIKEATPGGSIGILTLLDPSIVKSDKLSGDVVGLPGKTPPVLDKLELEVNLLKRMVGTKEELEVVPIKVNEFLMLNVNSAATVGLVDEVKGDILKCSLKLPVCAEKGSRVTISRRIVNRFRLIGYGIII